MDEWICERTTPDRMKCSEEKNSFFSIKCQRTSCIARPGSSIKCSIFLFHSIFRWVFFFCCWFFSCVGVDALSTAVLCGATSFNHISQCERCSISIELRLVLSTLLFFFFSSCARLWFALISTLRAFPWIPTGNLGIFWWWKWTTRDQTSICS